MIDIGQKMRFIPYFNINEKDDEAQRREKMIVGKVIYVNRKHKLFTVKFNCGGTMMKKTFKFTDIGEDIFVVRGRRGFGGGC